MEKKIIKDISKLEICSIVFFPLLLQNFCGRHFIYSSGISLLSSSYGAMGQLLINVFRWAVGFAGCFAVILFAEKVDEIFPDNKILNTLGDIGKYTLEIYILQRIVVEYIGAKFMWKVVNGTGIALLGNRIVYSYIFTPVCSIVFALFMYYIIKTVKGIGSRRKVHAD